MPTTNPRSHGENIFGDKVNVASNNRRVVTVKNVAWIRRDFHDKIFSIAQKKSSPEIFPDDNHAPRQTLPKIFSADKMGKIFSQEVNRSVTKEYYSELARRATIDEEAFEELYEYFFPRVYNFIFARLKNVADADDVVSETFLKMNENLESYDPAKAAFSTWLFRIANNTLIDYTRRRDKNNETEWDEFLAPAAPEHEEPEAVMMTSETSGELLHALNKLSERERRIVELKFWGDLDTRAIADVLSMTEGNVRVTLHRVLGKLKNILGDV